MIPQDSAAREAEPVAQEGLVKPSAHGKSVVERAKYVGAWESPERYVCFGSWMALNAMIQYVIKDVAHQMLGAEVRLAAQQPASMESAEPWREVQGMPEPSKYPPTPTTSETPADHAVGPGLSFDALRTANIARLPQFKNKHGDLAHAKTEGSYSIDGSDWSPAQWLQAVVGEIGEYANLRKKYERGDVDAATFKVEAGKELADVVIYLDILAKQLGIDLGDATISKFNEVSVRVGADVFLADRQRTTPETEQT